MSFPKDPVSLLFTNPLAIKYSCASLNEPVFEKSINVDEVQCWDNLLVSFPKTPGNNAFLVVEEV